MKSGARVHGGTVIIFGETPHFPCGQNCNLSGTVVRVQIPAELITFPSTSAASGV